MSARALPAAALLALLTALVYLNALHAPFVYDDGQLIIYNASIHDWRNWRYVLAGSQRPLVSYSYAINWAISGAAPFGFHLTNLAIHVLNVLLVFRLASVASERLTVAFAAAGLFALHPLLTESVAFLGARAGLLAATFLLLGTLALARAIAGGERRFLVAAAIAWLLALACKESAAMLPLAYLAYDRWLSPDDAAARRRRLWWFHAPLLALAAGAGIARVALHSLHEQASSRTSVDHLLGQADVIWRYLILFVAPISQTIRHSVPAAAPWHAWPAAAGLLALAAAAFLLRRRAPLAAFGAIWFLLFLIPSSVIPLLEKMAEHRVYEASFGLFLVAAVALDRLPRRAWIATIVILFGALSIGTVLRNRVWSNPVALWSEAARASPGDWGPHYALGDAWRDAGDCARAEPEYQRALQLKPSEARVHINRAICLAELGRLDEAETELLFARRLFPRSVTVHHDLGELARRRGRLDEARTWFRQALTIDPRYAPSRRALAELGTPEPLPE